MLAKSLESVAQTALPRILTQVCRDPNSPSFGCVDRNWWHYKIRDFPSIILQQAGYALAIAGDLSILSDHRETLRQLAAATCRFWNERAVKYGAFEEYYPFERGYPPLAFSTLAVAKMVLSGVVELEDVRPGLRKASKQLLRRFESQCANQQLAGTAAAAALLQIDEGLVNRAGFLKLLDKSLRLQTREGWFPEYDGPDLGYLTVTLDCLFDLLDLTGDERCRDAIERSFDYVAWFVLSPFGGAGMHNSRNTDYLVPYGLARLAAQTWTRQSEALSVFTRLFGKADSPQHFLAAIDERYWCHYIGHSVFRALEVLGKPNLSGLCASEANVWSAVGRFEKRDSGQYMRIEGEARKAALLVSAQKGGVLSAVWEGGTNCFACDFGWIVDLPGKQFVSHWWSSKWIVREEDDGIQCSGYLVPHREQRITPFKHFLLRLGSLVFGSRIIGPLKQLFIFKNQVSSFHFKRHIRFANGVLTIDDKIEGLPADSRIERAPRASKRHVSSADSYHLQDFKLSQDVEVLETRRKEGGTFCASLEYRPKGSQ